MKKTSGFRKASESVENTLSSGSLLRGLRPHMAKFWWPEVAGPQVAAVTQAERIESSPDRCVLVIRAKNSVWANELTLLKGNLLTRLNERLGGSVLTDLRFKASGLSRAPVLELLPAKAKQTREEIQRQQQMRDSITLHESERERIEVAVSEITDTALRGKVYNSLVNAARTTLWRRKQGWMPCSRCGTLTPRTQEDLGILCSDCRAAGLLR